MKGELTRKLLAEKLQWKGYLEWKSSVQLLAKAAHGFMVITALACLVQSTTAGLQFADGGG